MPKKSALYVLPLSEDKMLLLYSDEKNYPKFKAGDKDALFTGWEMENALIIEFEDGKPVFNGVLL